MNNALDLKGKRFERLTVVRLLGSNKYKNHVWECLCDCGNITHSVGTRLKRGIKKSCGCLIKDTHTKHGKTHTHEYVAWMNMKRRCCDENIRQYKDYGGRGISVCNRWLKSFNNFIEDMGEKPSSYHSIDRINNDGNYEPGNCRWATKEQQAINKRVFSNSATGVTGVSWRKSSSRWVANISANKTQTTLGYFTEIWDAICARKSAENKYWRNI